MYMVFDSEMAKPHRSHVPESEAETEFIEGDLDTQATRTHQSLAAAHKILLLNV